MTATRENLARVDHHVYKTWLKVLFRAALIDNPAWQDRMRTGTSQDVIEHFAKYVERIVPVIAIESSLPYAEHLLIELIGEHAKFNHKKGLEPNERSGPTKHVASEIRLSARVRSGSRCREGDSQGTKT